MLEESPKSRIELPAAAAAAAAAVSVLARQQLAGGVSLTGGLPPALVPPLGRDSSAAEASVGQGVGREKSAALTERLKPPKRGAADERSTKRCSKSILNGTVTVGVGENSRRRRLQYAE